MSANDRLLLGKVLEKRRAEVAPDRSVEWYFNVFCAEQILKEYDLDYNEIEQGIVDGSQDGGIDAIYAFANGVLLAEDTDPDIFKKDIVLTLHVISATTSDSFEEVPIQKLESTTRHLLDLTKPVETYVHLYNGQLRSGFANFRRITTDLIAKFPRLVIHYHRVTQGDRGNLSQGVLARAEALKACVQSMLPKSDCDLSFLGARELLDLAGQPRSQTHKLPIAGTYIGMPDGRSYVCLVKLADLFHFIADQTGVPRRELLEANVRDYLGDVHVNEAIAQSLAAGEDMDFWWLNNGATIIASEGDVRGNVLVLRDPRVVNGLQTSMETYRYFADHPEAVKRDNRHLLIKVIVTEDDACRDRIITATNSQTAIPPGSLRATDRIHRNIELYFEQNGLYYDRRKNYHKNEGKPIDKIISIPYLAQAVAAILLQEPDNARARPSSLLKDDQHYSRVFNDSHSLPCYLTCTRIMRRVDDYLRTADGAVSPADKTNLRFYLAMCAAIVLSGELKPSARCVEAIADQPMTDGMLSSMLTSLRSELHSFVQEMGHAWDEPRAAKSREFRERVQKLVAQQLTS